MSAQSPVAVYNAATGDVTLTGISGANVVWGTNLVWGTNVVWGTNATEALNVLWGTNVVWGTNVIFSQSDKAEAESTKLLIKGDK